MFRFLENIEIFETNFREKVEKNWNKVGKTWIKYLIQTLWNRNDYIDVTRPPQNQANLVQSENHLDLKSAHLL